MIDRGDVEAAATRIRAHVRRTPSLVTPEVTLKCEHLQVTGVFKARGAINRLLGARERGELDPSRGVVIASGGNAGLATAWAAARVGVPSTVFVPGSAPDVKVRLLESHGATVRRVGREYADAWAAAVEHADATGALLSHAYDQPEVVAGAGTIGLEVLDDDPSTTTIVVSAGGGGLFAGIAAAVEGRARVVVVEPAGSTAVHAALQAGRPVDVPVASVAADSLGARRIGDIAWAVARRTDPLSVLVDDDTIVAARLALWREHRIVAEHGAATAYAALTGGAYRPEPGERVCVVVCGANTDPATLVDVGE